MPKTFPHKPYTPKAGTQRTIRILYLQEPILEAVLLVLVETDPSRQAWLVLRDRVLESPAPEVSSLLERPETYSKFHKVLADQIEICVYIYV